MNSKIKCFGTFKGSFKNYTRLNEKYLKLKWGKPQNHNLKLTLDILELMRNSNKNFKHTKGSFVWRP